MNYPLQIIKQFFTLDNKFATEAVLEKRMQTVYVLVSSIMWYLQMGREHILSLWRSLQYSLPQYIVHVFAER